MSPPAPSGAASGSGSPATLNRVAPSRLAAVDDRTLDAAEDGSTTACYDSPAMRCPYCSQGFHDNASTTFIDFPDHRPEDDGSSWYVLARRCPSCAGTIIGLQRAPMSAALGRVIGPPMP